MTNKTLLTIAICTHNRSNDVSECLLSLTDQINDHNNIELIIVDNSSNKKEARSTKTVALAYNATYIVESHIGLSIARNTALKNAHGKFIAYIDDDAVAHSDWLKNSLGNIEKFNPDMMGGPIQPLWKHAPPRWLTPSLHPLFSILNIQCQEMPSIYGANMIFKVAALKSVGGFPPNLGRKNNRLISCEETYVKHVFKSQNKTITFAENTIVNHKVPSNRMTRLWVFQRAFWQGYSQILMKKILKKDGIKLTKNDRQKSLTKKKNYVAYISFGMIVLGYGFAIGKSAFHSGISSLTKHLKSWTSF